MKTKKSVKIRVNVVTPAKAGAVSKISVAIRSTKNIKLCKTNPISKILKML